MSLGSRPSTPSHHPNFGVHMSTESIESVVHFIFPNTTAIEVEPLPSFKSFNNRIYYLHCHKNTTGENTKHIDPLVLKINGRVFGAEKIQNEVSCLRLLEDFCPGIPVPRALAWSQDGTTIETRDSQSLEMKLSAINESHGGWILMTRVPGEPIDLSVINENDRFQIATQLADHVTNWRQNTPLQRYAGNLYFKQVDDLDVDPDIVLPALNGSGGVDLFVRGMLGEELHCPCGIDSLADYYQLRIENKVKALETSETFAPNKNLINCLQIFVQKNLPTLRGIKTEEDLFAFTHYDLSPRNILVSGHPLQITGIVDFEFSGFFPTLDEFLSDCIANEGDWPKDMYEVYLKRLESNGIPTPLEGIPRDRWEQMCLLEELVEKIAPWWLPGEHQGEKLEEELKRVKVRVEEVLAKLRK
ncbi:kinase-like domain protein [Fusarium beomiforme]|uniref:Kinase-like domain protein n=1 Tax=Fusarium beomiforme TaxID=44412 RepID=A0A9P5AAV1_9HYPO|nr:kinase-like domain protein [Fusarium beomiforme]